MVVGCSVTGLPYLPSKCLVGYLTDVDQSESPDGLITDDDFAQTVRTWLADNLTGDFARLKGKGGPGREHEFFEERLAWDRHLAAAGWTCLGWPKEHGGRGATLAQQVIFHQEYAEVGRAGPGQSRRRGTARADAHRVRHRGAEASLPARHQHRDANCGRRATPSRAPVPTSRTSRPPRAATATSG